jgi:predicted TPR repeat methyltransferase
MTTAESSEQQSAWDMSLDEALSLAVQLHRADHLDEAEAVYGRILAVAPDHADALNFMGILAVNRGQIDRAIELMERSIALDPGHADRYNNLGNVFITAERFDEAVAAYEKALELAPTHASAYSNLGIIYRLQRRFNDAARAYERAIELDPYHDEAYNNYGNLHQARGDIKQAIQYYSKALTLRPHDPGAKMSIAIAHATLGNFDAAADIYRDWLKSEPDHPGVRHLLAACSGEGVPARAADDYVEQTFDSFSKTFDVKLARLEYRAPKLVAEALRKVGARPDKRLTILDAGCGTGLCGPLLAPYVSRLEGVDLSGGMLDGARARGGYDVLVKGELTAFLKSCGDAYDVIVSADTLVYFGVLDDVLQAASGALRRGALFIFTLERADEADAPEGHRLNPHGRYSHTRDYIQRTLAKTGFDKVGIEDDVLRLERGEPVVGFVVTARKALNTE